MVSIINKGDTIDKVIHIFKKQVEKAAIISDYKKHLEFEKPSIYKKKKSIAARKRHQKQLRKMEI